MYLTLLCAHHLTLTGGFCATSRNPDANATKKAYIKKLHDYNDTKDMASALMGMVAEHRGVRFKDVMEEFGVGPDD